MPIEKSLAFKSFGTVRTFALAWTLTVVSLVPVRGADPPLLTRLLARAGDYVRDFEQNFAFVVSDEDYRQHARGRRYIAPLHRRTRAEMLFMWLSDEAVWLTVRNVLTADGHPVPGSQSRLNDVLRDAGAERLPRLRGLIDYSARFNLGQTFRNFNYPTQALSYLDPVLQPRFAFTLAGRERVNRVDTWKIKYEELTTPTVIQANGADRPSRGAVWIADRDGAIVRTKLDLMIPVWESIASVSVDVDYQRDMKLDMWVPLRMHETYLEMRGSTVTDSIGCEATYSNFRRFETSGRMLVPK
jgi:hypothetical protein